MARTIGEQVYEDQVASGQIQLPNVLPQDYGYTGLIDEDSEFNTPYGTRTGIAGYYDKFKSPITSGYSNYVTPLIGSAISAFTGIPGIGLLMSRLPNDTQRNIFNRSFTVGGSNMLTDPYGYYSSLRAGNLNQDPFGRNTVSAFGNYEQTLANDANYTGTNKFRQDKADFAKDYFEKNAINAGGVTVDNTVYSGADYQGDGGGGNQGQRDAGPGFSGSGSAAEMGSFRRGGLASL